MAEKIFPVPELPCPTSNGVRDSAVTGMEPERENTYTHFDNIFITTIKADSANINWRNIQKENTEAENDRNETVNESRSIKTHPIILCSTVIEKDSETQDKSSLVQREKADKRKLDTPQQCTQFSDEEVLADLKFCVPRSVEKKQKLGVGEKETATMKGRPGVNKTTILKICKRLIYPKNVKAVVRKQWRKNGLKIKTTDDKTLVDTSEVESTGKNPAESSRVITAHTKWQSPEEMRKVFNSICQVCFSSHEENCNSEDTCPLLNPTSVIHHNPTSRLGYELPREIFLGYSRIYDDRLSLFARDAIPKLTQFGPLKGRRLGVDDLSKICLPDIDLDHFWPVKISVKPHDYLTVDEYIDTADEAVSNWTRFLLPEHATSLFANDCSPLKANVQRILKEDNIYFVTIRDIEMGEELFLRCLEPPQRIYFNLASMAYSGSSLNKTKVKVLLDDCTTCKGKLPEKFPFQNMIRMVRHRRMMHNTLPSMCDFANIFHCNFCGVEFRFQTELRKHRKEKHLTDDNNHNTQCQYCKVYKKSVDALSGHMSAVHFVSSKHPVTCTLCGLKFPTHGKYQQHRVNEHRPDQSEGADSKNTCSLCGKAFKTFSTLRKHIWKVHEKKDYRICESCGKSFKDKYQLKVHTLTHSGIKPFQCDIQGCTGAFTTKQWLQKHYRMSHNFSEDNMPEIRRKIDFSDNVILTAKAQYNNQFEKPVHSRVVKPPRNSNFQADLSEKNSSDAVLPKSTVIESNHSHFTVTDKRPPPNVTIMNESINLRHVVSSLPSGITVSEITNPVPQDFNNRGIASQNCVPMSHFTALSHGMAVQNVLQPPRGPPPPLPPAFNEQQLVQANRWVANQANGAPNQQIPHLQGMFDSGYYSMHDFY